MKPFSILLIKMLGLYLSLNAFFSVVPAMLSPNLKESLSGDLLLILIATIVVPIVGGIVLWSSAGALANRIHGNHESPIDVKDNALVRAGTFLMGVFLLVQHVGSLISRYAASGDIAYGSLVVLVISLFMVLGTGFIGSLYQKLKYVGSTT
ncbi:hypothetical protein [Vreelandella arcis]|uniref:DUF2975 domain-containing protein n=1 Tax=Vreelandella arcis TaxID=416873 RepID=A0A1H0JNN3_9GAMM|nr:hypothetical protein [Halomonas arcis]SDO45378.1 hypothetical protein SAMN04487951_13016 [Halomonas arcis]